MDKSSSQRCSCGVLGNFCGWCIVFIAVSWHFISKQMGTKSQTAAVGTSRIAICLFLTERSCLEKSGPILINAEALKRPAMMISYAIPLFPFPNVHKTSFLGLHFFWYHPGSHFSLQSLLSRNTRKIKIKWQVQTRIILDCIGVLSYVPPIPPTMWREKCLSQHRHWDQQYEPILRKGFLIDRNQQCRWHRRPCDKCDFLEPASDLQNNSFKQSQHESNASDMFSWPNYNRLDQRWLSYSSAAKPQAPLWAYGVLWCEKEKQTRLPLAAAK